MSESLQSHGLLPPGSCVHGISQARTLECIAIQGVQGIFLTQGWKPSLLHPQADFAFELPGRPYLLAYSIASSLCLWQGLRAASG